MSRRAPLLLALLLSALLLVVVLAIATGPVTFSLSQSAGALLAGPGESPDGGSLARRIIWSLRLPRTLLAALTGAALALCGTVLQALTRNDLADPWVLGISSGAGAGAVLVIAAGWGAGWAAVPLGAFGGAALAFLLVLILARASLAGQSGRLVLTGVAVTQLLSALTSLITFWKTDADTSRGVMFWLLGSFTRADWPQVLLCGLVLGGIFLLLHRLAPTLDVLAVSPLTASTVGVDVARITLLIYSLTTLLTAIVVACCGAIGFIGLTVPHIARMLSGRRHGSLLPVAMLCGAMVTVLADTLARTLFAPRELPVGILTALLGVPVFLLLVARTRRGDN
ncbi:FecCD family ABC transporter permease [Shimwellia blattae]|uniref:FecCD-family membrane transport protein n=1 Tax=Shimwellia blattae (strain ATCC 29907 / DSM 4481 / JCM 1650 / NBRC 105725 / CDC 9005-74) TaxID=630626 RepID=I2B8H3_SHIBC|nr:iron ABC transporter permease [Shimwellia blattae]AFJ46827.1 FecCD-family membrane transport protein [Shimwellia blattae DSM 4481 = NBRC 105725]GAB82967.1 putative ABC transporter permease protein [Shimwellia blattae DSM 4481 = NBRC 105725]VDY64307.1 Probable ABC transporter permease protein HI_1471 [Shimwellia blattae]VEC22431.1 Probable ABC transporter permease protein HI_1471 [Shimwellia blattae]